MYVSRIYAAADRKILNRFTPNVVKINEHFTVLNQGAAITAVIIAKGWFCGLKPVLTTADFFISHIVVLGWL